jgi:hypothetical protein
MMKFKFAKSLVFTIALFIGITAVNVYAQDDSELVKTANDFSQAFKLADDKKMQELLSEDFQYFTNVSCGYKDCEKGAKKADYISGILSERKVRDFTISSVKMKYVKPIVNTNIPQTERKVSFYCTVEMKAKDKPYRFYSIIDYSFIKSGDTWKITKIENKLIAEIKQLL